MKRFFIISLLIVTGTFTHAESEYEAWLKQNTVDLEAVQQEFQDYMDANDKEFVGFLKQQWTRVTLEKPEVLDKTPKPVLLPKAPEPKTPIHSEPAPSPDHKPLIENKPHPSKPPIVKLRPVPAPKPTPAIKPPKPLSQMVKLAFIGHTVSLPKLTARSLTFNQKLSSKSIANHWSKLAKQKHKHVITALKQQQTTLNLNDWALALLTSKYAEEIGLHGNSKDLFTWFLLVKAGYNTRLAYNSQAFVLMPSKQPLYGVTYFTMKGQRFYAVSFDGKKVNTGRAYTYTENHGSARHWLDFSGASNILPSGKNKQKQLAFSYQSKKHQINLDYDLGMVLFSNTLPQMDIQYYPKQGLPSHTARQLLKQLQPLVRGLSEVEAVNVILRFVQTAFAYQTDGQQFNTENYLLPIETLHYPYSDCEDRASIFTWLVESLLDLDAVLLDYPGHIAAAVAFRSPPKGDRVKFNGKSYTVTDPTYINAKAGMTMPQFKKVIPKVFNF